jgi:hypothetical protein
MNEEPIKVLAATPKKIERMVKGATPAKQRPAPGSGPAEIVAHLADAEIVIGWRVRAIPAPGTPIQAFDQMPGPRLATTPSAIRD